MGSEDYGKDLASVQNLLKKHQLLEADILAHEDRVKDMNIQADSLLESDQFDRGQIQERRKSINERYDRSAKPEFSGKYDFGLADSEFCSVKDLANQRRERLNEALTLHQFFRDIDDEESWIK